MMSRGDRGQLAIGYQLPRASSQVTSPWRVTVWRDLPCPVPRASSQVTSPWRVKAWRDLPCPVQLPRASSQVTSPWHVTVWRDLPSPVQLPRAPNQATSAFDGVRRDSLRSGPFAAHDKPAHPRDDGPLAPSTDAGRTGRRRAPSDCARENTATRVLPVGPSSVHEGVARVRRRPGRQPRVEKKQRPRRVEKNNARRLLRHRLGSGEGEFSVGSSHPTGQPNGSRAPVG